MKTFVWRDLIKVVTGEITRLQQLRLQRDIANMAAIIEDMSNEEALMYLDDLMAMRATRALYVCVDGAWQEISAPLEVEVSGEPLTFAMPMTPELFQQLPGSLTTPWLDAVQEENQFVIDRFLSFMRTETDILNSLAPSSAAAPSSDP